MHTRIATIIVMEVEADDALMAAVEQIEYARMVEAWAIAESEWMMNFHACDNIVSNLEVSELEEHSEEWPPAGAVEELVSIAAAEEVMARLVEELVSTAAAEEVRSRVEETSVEQKTEIEESTAVVPPPSEDESIFSAEVLKRDDVAVADGTAMSLSLRISSHARTCCDLIAIKSAIGNSSIASALNIAVLASSASDGVAMSVVARITGQDAKWASIQVDHVVTCTTCQGEQRVVAVLMLHGPPGAAHSALSRLEGASEMLGQWLVLVSSPVGNTMGLSLQVCATLQHNNTTQFPSLPPLCMCALR